MAIFYWSDHLFTGTIASKAANNTGITNVTIDATHDDMFVGNVVNPTLSTYTTKSITNKGAGSTTNSKFLFYLGISNSGSTSVEGTVSSKVLWAGKSTYADTHSVQVGIKRAATAVTIAAKGSELFNDDLGTIQYTTATASGATAYTQASYTDAKFTTTGCSITSTGVKLNDNVFATSGEATVSVAAYWEAGVLADGQIDSNTITFSVKNAVKDVVIDNETTAKTIYVAQGASKSFSYTVVPEQAGVAYSYTLTPTLAGGAATAIEVTSQTAPTKTAAGTWAITGKTVGVYTVSFKSDATADEAGKTSPIITIVVTPASMSYSINCGDTVTIAAGTIPAGTVITATTKSNISSTVPTTFGTGIVAVMTGLDGQNRVQDGTDIVIYASNASMGTAEWSIDGGSTITVAVSHIAVTIA